ncbi:LTA synthase family protein [Gorillibacterium timonense]|uniref:LTA synthase family protein n=1 Tax=Gorillibacterium timonense TaxID=1689269 RepID=UPI00071D9882|nr:LTA synthase family protein [Gorillibacterium timonense]
MRRKGLLTAIILLGIALIGGAFALAPGQSALDSKSPQVNAEEIKETQNKATPNIIAIQLESFQSFVLGKTIEGQEITPNLNSLMKDSLTYPNFYLQNGAGNTVDAEFMFNTSLHPVKPPNVIAFTDPMKEFPSLPRILREKGYSTITMHTNNAMFYNRKEFYSALGFERFLDKDYFGTDDFIAFGSSDDILYDKGMDAVIEYAKEGKPFYAQFVSMSSHHPFRLPEKFRELELSELYQDNMAGDYLQATRYTDTAIGHLIERLKKDGLWENTILVLYGDHTGIQMKMVEDAEKAALKEIVGHEYTLADALRVPLIIHGPGIEAKVDETYGGHMDMLPTLLSLTGNTPANAKFFGYDLTSGQAHTIPIRGAFADEGSFIDEGTLYNPVKETSMDLATGESKPVDKSVYQAKYDDVLARFQASEEYVKGLPEKKEDFGEKVVLTEPAELYATADMTSPLGITVPKTTVTSKESKPEEGWYKIEYEGKSGWIKPERPILELWGLIKPKNKMKLYKEPDDTLEPVLSVGIQNLNVTQRWVGTKWYKIVTWAGEFWGQVEE